ncbi:hypothetical protein D3C85_989690 [compost metagenome]
MSMVSISAGLISPSGLLVAEFADASLVGKGIPSTTTNGNELNEIELTPLTRITGGLFNKPLG